MEETRTTLGLTLLIAITLLAPAIHGDQGAVLPTSQYDGVLVIDVKPSYMTDNGVPVIQVNDTGYGVPSLDTYALNIAKSFLQESGAQAGTPPAAEAPLQYEGPGTVFLVKSVVGGVIVYASSNVDLGRLVEELQNHYPRAVVILLHIRSLGNLCKHPYDDKLVSAIEQDPALKHTVLYVDCFPPSIGVDPDMAAKYNMTLENLADKITQIIHDNNFYVVAVKGLYKRLENAHITWYNTTNVAQQPQATNDNPVQNEDSKANTRENTAIAALASIIAASLAIALYRKH